MLIRIKSNVEWGLIELPKLPLEYMQDTNLG